MLRDFHTKAPGVGSIESPDFQDDGSLYCWDSSSHGIGEGVVQAVGLRA
jgi:hypothetical protein